MRMLAAAVAAALLAACSGGPAKPEASGPPNFVLVFCDDLGYGDLGAQGSPDILTPNIDRMAREGMRFTSFYAQPVCGPSRAALMTGSYPPRVSLAFNHLPKFETGIHPDEQTVAELLRERGYATGMAGKWHLGDHPSFLPARHGFDDFFGIPYSNDMWPFHPKMPLGDSPAPRLLAARQRAERTGFAGQGEEFPAAGGFPHPLPLLDGERTVETDPDQSRLSRRFTDRALAFIEANRERPFFLYVAHVMPHVPLFAGAEFEGKSARGLYGDTVEEIDAGVGEILAKLAELGLDERTLVVFTSDNGPWLEYGIDGGSAGPLRGGKGTAWEGGSRVPAIFRWPGRIPAGTTTREVATTMDLLPTFVRLAGGEPPADRTIDGQDIRPLLFGEPGARSPHESLFFFGGDLFGVPGATGPTPSAFEIRLQAVRRGEWKLHLDEETLTGRALYHLGWDVGERDDVLARHPEVAAEIERAARDMVRSLQAETRPLGRLSQEESRQWTGK